MQRNFWDAAAEAWSGLSSSMQVKEAATLLNLKSFCLVPHSFNFGMSGGEIVRLLVMRLLFGYDALLITPAAMAGQPVLHMIAVKCAAACGMCSSNLTDLDPICIHIVCCILQR